MKLLGWMHRKLMQNNIEPTKSSLIGNTTSSTCFSVQMLFDEKNYYVEPTRTLSYSKLKCPKSSSYLSEEANNVEELFQEESFDFLAIGTFGLELLNTDPPTPTLPLHFDEFTNQQKDITENDLRLINYELEKLLEAEENEVQPQRISIASTITLNNKLIEAAELEERTYVVNCPLQNYLFASSIELSDTDKEVKKEKTTLEELFKRSDKVQDDSVTKCEGAEQKTRRRNVAHFVKKVVKKFHTSSTSSKVSSKNGDDFVSFPTKKKLHKVLKMFHKKVHPEEMADKKFIEKNSLNIEDDPYHQIDETTDYISIDDNTILKQQSSSDGGHWIKTDSDYLVLEL